jgi:hypothetical protein
VGGILEFDQDGDAVEAENQATIVAARVSRYRDPAPGALGHKVVLSSGLRILLKMNSDAA